MPRRQWTAAEDKQLRQRYPTELAKDLAIEFGRSLQSIYARAEVLGLKKDLRFVAEVARRNSSTPGHGGERTRFYKGQPSPNLGIKGVSGLHENSRKNWFQPGQINGRANQLIRPIGSYRIASNGYLEQKVSDAPGRYDRRWKAVHRLLWEATNGPVPDDHVVVFKAGRPITELHEITLDALELVTRADLMRRNSYHVKYPEEIARLVQLRGAITRQINRRARKEPA